ncbi:hypothetical protein Zmor_010072 [Zophobas morio]|uniref:Natterin-4 n=1 Tax=Zophobas morio TaxID=2755281 RepID=A0AA38MJH2_9CUCU|nr:hypothetical protein Zmor_010072 [Zophobas morio]
MAGKTPYHWVNSCVCEENVPPMAVQMGFDTQNHPVYIGRAHFGNELAPVHVVPAKRAAYVAHDGKEHPVQNYEILCINYLKWVPARGGHVPAGAVQAGHNKDGAPLYVGRVSHDGSWIIGKIHPKFGVCYFPSHGKEVKATNYEALVCQV